MSTSPGLGHTHYGKPARAFPLLHDWAMLPLRDHLLELRDKWIPVSVSIPNRGC